MALVVGAIPHSEWQRLTPLLEALGWDSRNASAAESWYRDEAAGTQGAGENLYVLLHSRPEYCIARAINNGSDLGASVSTWLRSAEALLACFRGKRARAILVDVDAACANPRSLLDWLFQHNDPFKPIAEYARHKSLRVGSVQDGQDLETNLNLLLAIQTVNQSEEIADLMPYYEASSVPVETGIYKQPVVDLLSTYSRLQNLNQTYSEMQGRMAIFQEEAEAYKKESEGYKKEVEDSKKELSGIAEKLHQREEIFAKLKEENQIATQNLFKVQEDLERYYISDKEKSSEIKSLSERLNYTSSELTKYSQDKQKEIDSIRKTINKKDHELARRAKQIQLLERKVNDLDCTLARVQNSMFWRASFPVRWLLQKLKRLGGITRHNKVKRQAKLVKQSELFDADWYLENYPDVKSSGAKPEEHYIRFGGEDGRDPGPYFSSKNYLQANPDVAKAKINPLVHYIKYGKSEGRRLV